MNILTNQKLYWLNVAEEDLITCKSLFKTKRYLHCLFFADLTIEMALKALVIHDRKRLPPYIHNLEKIYSLTNKDLDISIDFLRDINEYNINARYPDEREKLRKGINEKTIGDTIITVDQIFTLICNKIQQ
jgi:HEPN domain-containing protein